MANNIIRFISLEGIDGTGKSTQIQKLYQYLQERNYKTTITREPGGTTGAEKIREILLNQDLNNMTRTLLFQASRIENVKNVVIPAIKNDYIVLTDRFIDSTMVYQGQSLGKDLILKIHEKTTENLFPDITFLLIADIPVAMARIHRRGLSNQFDNLERYHYESLQKSFLNLAQDFPERIKIIDANKSAEDVFLQIRSILDQYL